MGITYEVKDAVAHIRFDRPEKLNALTLDMYEVLAESFKRANDDPAVRAILLGANGGRAFCVGADLGESIPALAQGRFDISQWDGAHLKQSGFYKPVVAAINGLCMGGGFEIMLATDIRIAASTAEFALPEAALGFTPAGGTLVRLVRQIPYAYAMELMLTAERFPALRLAEMGLLNRVVPPEDLESVALAYAQGIAQKGQVAVSVIKEAALTLAHLPLDEAFRKEAVLGQRAFTCDEAKEGLQRFLSRNRGRAARG
ncbi:MULTISPECIES: enoyl-CoA hydratase/isomerase family protein [unclassified Achromobacter]|uniref:enoyl-CoA hydratase/isomerase family protein n=1 Tax=unclassified Achromobacter TaxID=2626865 RepID=UPI000B51AF13|nr:MULTISPECIES: enoyl-CoA hydratase/isomerase family protein [unclassified Achromobacter]OWT80835.1 enoyl-CoA hydratase [Achromobacter sp. HZ34]OWT81351.1 enoyl-CoA hydratase [Achromobacter sp. HZ28]